MADKSGSGLIAAHKKIVLIVVIGFFLIELQILVMASMKSGKQSWLRVLDDGGRVIYEVKGSTLTNFNKYYFENTFGRLDQYQVELYTREIPFPFRAWLSASVGVPVGLTLLLAFVLKAAVVLIHGRTGPNGPVADTGRTPEPTARSLLLNLARLDIFIIGFLLLCGVLLFWIVPNLLTFLARAGIETFENYKYFFMAITAALLALFAGFMYMKYQLARKSMEAQTEIRKLELQLAHDRRLSGMPALDMDHGSGHTRQRIGHDDSDGPAPADGSP